MFAKDHTKFRCVSLISFIAPITYAVSPRGKSLRDLRDTDAEHLLGGAVAAYSVQAIDLPICQINRLESESCTRIFASVHQSINSRNEKRDARQTAWQIESVSVAAANWGPSVQF